MGKSIKQLVAVGLTGAICTSLASGLLAAPVTTTAASQGTRFPTAVVQAQAYGLMSGYSAGEFGEQDLLNRAMWVTILENMCDGATAQGGQSVTFTDVAAGDWFAKGVAWAAAKGITSGYPDGSFGATQSLNRQELAVMSLKYAQDQKLGDTMAAAQLTDYSDADSVAAWAQSAYSWCLAEGVLQPETSGKLNPTAPVTREESASAAVALFGMEPIDFDVVSALTIDWSQAAQLPLTGYFTKTVAPERTVKVYIAPEASVRTYITVVAVPDGVDTQKFLTDEGWFELMDQKGEALFVLEPGKDGWGTVEQEQAYYEAATTFLKRGANDNKVGVFSTFGEFYLVGYGAGATALEAWAAENPIFVTSQVYLDGKSAGRDYLASRATTAYDGVVSGNGYAPIPNLDEVIKQVGIAGAITAADVPVPTWFVNYAASADNIAYWKKANDTVDTAKDGVFHQSIQSDAYQTDYANGQIVKNDPNAVYGISQVKLTTGQPDAKAVYDFLSTYTRYDNSLAYSNSITYRLDYTAARVTAQQQAGDAQVKSTLSDGTQILGQGDVTIPGHGTVQVGIIAFADDNHDGKVDPRQYLVYIPEGFQGKKLPIMYVFPGNTQSDVIFFDSTSWLQIAQEKGVALAFVCETYSAPTAITHLSAHEMLASLNTVMREKIDKTYAQLDFTRVYATGQSMGSMYVQDMVRSNPEYFSAIATTSGIVSSATPIAAAQGSGNMIPAAMICGQGDNTSMTPDLWSSEQSSEWASYLLNVNGAGALDRYDTLDELVMGRTNLYTWRNEAEIPMFQWGQTLLRPHNCYPSDMWILWDFVEHFSQAADGSRYYSPSAFEKEDAVKLN